MTTTTTFDAVPTATSPGYSRYQRIGRGLWPAMLLVGLAGFAVSWALGIAAANATASTSPPPDLVEVARLRHLIPAFASIGFGGVLTAISLAVARVLGAFRKGGGEVQEAAGGDVQTPRTPGTARVLVAFTTMGALAVLAAAALHFVAATAVDATNLGRALGEWIAWLEAIRRLGVGLILFGIVAGLGTVIHELRFQAVRIRELAG